MLGAMTGMFETVSPAAEEAALLAAARRLDGRALAAIHDRHYPDLYRYLLFRTRDETVAEDLTSEVFMRLLNALRAGKAPDTLHAWLFGVANHLATDHFRRQARRPQVELVEEIAADDEAADPEIVSSANQATAAVRAALQELTEEQQRVLALRFGEGRSVNDTAELIGKSVTAVKQLQFRAVAALRRKLEGIGA
jgi:RNA polymerase sigma-70 factor (ECF subfamily)